MHFASVSVFPATIPGLPELAVILFIFVAIIGIPAVLFGIVLLVVRRRGPSLDELDLEDPEADGDSH